MNDNDPFQPIVGPLEHREFAEDFVKENPAIAIPSLAVGTPLYTAAKALGVHAARSPASVDEIFAGYEGLIRGTRSLLNKGN
jgi:hypothetical protein